MLAPTRPKTNRVNMNNYKVFRWNNCVRNLTLCAFTLMALLAFSLRANAALNLEKLWTTEAHMVMEGAPMVVDLDGDGSAEVLTAAYENLIAVDGSGKER